MSLDVSLYIKKPHKSKIVRNGKRVLYSEIYDALGIEDRPLEFKEVCVFDYNITHNLGPMAEAAGVYQALWRPEDIPVSKAGDLIELLSSGLQRLTIDPDEYKKLNPNNGWGSYDGLVRFVESYLEACKEFPGAGISVSR